MERFFLKKLVPDQNFQRNKISMTVLQQLRNQSGHLGLWKTWQERYYWAEYEADVATWINECKQCQQRNPPQPHNKHHWSQLRVTTLSLDIMGPLPLTTAGNKYIMVVTDLFSKWVEAFPVKATDTETLASLLVNEVVCRYGVPLYLHSDQGNLTSNLMIALCKQLRITQTRTGTNAYHPQGNGQVERFNQTLESMLAKVAKLIGIITFPKSYLHIELPSMTRLDLPLSTSHLAVPLYCRHLYNVKVPSFVTKLHNSLHSAYTAVRAHITSSHQRNKERYDKERLLNW